MYLTKYQYAKKGGSDYPHVFLAASSGSSRVPSSPPVTGANILGYIAYYAACGAASTDIKNVESWGAPYNTLQFKKPAICAP